MSANIAAKARPPRMPVGAVLRPRLETLRQQALVRRLSLVIAGAGYGKSTLLASWAASGPSVWYTLDATDTRPEVLGKGLLTALSGHVDIEGLERVLVEGPDAFGSALSERLSATGGLLVILDDVHEIGSDGPSPRLLEIVLRGAPEGVHAVLGSRAEPPFAVSRMRASGEVLDLGPGELAFTPDEVEAVLAVALDEDATMWAAEIHDATAGWPVAVRFAVERLRMLPAGEMGAAIDGLRHPSGALSDYLIEEVLSRLPRSARELVAAGAHLGRFDAGLCEAAGIAGAAGAIEALRSGGPFLERHDGDWFSLHGAVRDRVLAGARLDGEHARAMQVAAALHLSGRGEVPRALEMLSRAGAHAEAAELLRARGEALVAAGEQGAVAAAISSLPEQMRADLGVLEGDALLAKGDLHGALMRFERAAGRGADLRARIATIHLRLGRSTDAGAILTSGRSSDDRSDLIAEITSAAARFHVGAEPPGEETMRYHGALVRRAEELGDDEVLAAAHTAAAIVAFQTGDHVARERHLALGLTAAERVSDVMQQIRIRSNRSAYRKQEGRLEDALADAEVALDLARSAGASAAGSFALMCKGMTLAALGRLDHAVGDLSAARAGFERSGSGLISYAHAALGDAYRERGEPYLALESYEAGIAAADRDGNAQALAHCLSQAARTCAEEDPDRARELAGRAESLARAGSRVMVELASGWVALRAGDAEVAAGHAREAEAIARRRGERAGVAEALELAACASPSEAARRLDDALQLWRDCGAVLRAAWVRLAMQPDRASIRGEIEALGVRSGAARMAGLPMFIPTERPAQLSVRTLGGFGVSRAGEPVPLPEWGSRKARDLVKILVSRRGRATPREMIIEDLWPGEDGQAAARRLSVLVTTVRNIFDPQRSGAADAMLPAGDQQLSLALDALEVDVENFLRAAADALSAYASGAPDAWPAIHAATAMYTGDFLEEDPYAPWAAGLREEARTTFISLCRAGADLAARSGDGGAAHRMLLRMLEKDPYDEDAHLQAIRAAAADGRHGEARRLYRSYAARMDEISVEPAPLARVLTPS